MCVCVRARACVILHCIILYIFSVVRKHSSIFCTKQDLAIKGLYTSKINSSLHINIQQQLFIYVGGRICTLLRWL